MLFKLFTVELIVLGVVAWAALYKRGRYFVPVVVGLAARLLLIWVYENTLLFGTSDIGDYLVHFKEFEHRLLKGEFYWGIHVPAYTALYPGWIYAFFGSDGFWLIRLANAAVSVLVLGPLVRIHRLVLGRPMSVKLSFLVLLWPTWLRYSIEVGRSSIISLFVLFTLALLIEIVERFSLRTAVMALIGMLGSVFLRVHNIGFFVMPLVTFFLIRIKRERNKYLRLLLYPVVIGFILLTVIGAVRFYLVFTGGGRFDIRSISQLVAYASLYRELGGSVYLAGVYPSSLLDLVWYLPLHAFYFMFSPMPWDADKPFVIGSSLQAWILLTLMVASFRSSPRVYRTNRRLQLVMLTSLVVMVGYGAVTKNAGGAERWRLPITQLFLVLLPPLAKPREALEENRLLSSSSPETAST